MNVSYHHRAALVAGALVLVLAQGCSSSGGSTAPGTPTPKPGPAPNGNAPPPPAGGHGPAVTYKPVRDARYRLEHHDSLNLQYEGGAVQQQVKDRVAFLRVTLAEGAAQTGYTVSVALDSLDAVESGQPVPPDSVAAARGTVWTGTLSPSGQLSALSANRSSTLSDEIGSRIPLLFPALPPGGVREGMEWTDTTQRKVVADAFPVTETSIVAYKAADTEEQGPRQQKAIELESSGTYSRSGTRVQADQELQMTATGTVKEVHHLGLDGALVSAQGTDSGEMTISVPALGQTVPVTRASRYAISPAAPAGHYAPALVASAGGAGRRAAGTVLGLAARGLATAPVVPEPLARRDRVHGGRRRADSLPADSARFDRPAARRRRARRRGRPLPPAPRHRLV